MFKELYIRLSVMSAAVLAAVSCASEGTETKPDAGYGTLGMGSLMAVVSEDGVRQPATRAVETGEFIVRIMDAGQQVADQWTMDARPQEVTLQVGDYTLEVCSSELRGADWECPWYVGRENFAIADKGRTEIENVTCRLGNVKATVHYSEELKELLGDDVQVSVSIGANELLYALGERRGGYFAVGGAEADMTVVFEGTIDGVWEKHTNVIKGAKPGDWQRIRFTFEENDGFRTFLVTVYGSDAGQIGDGDEWF